MPMDADMSDKTDYYRGGLESYCVGLPACVLLIECELDWIMYTEEFVW